MEKIATVYYDGEVFRPEAPVDLEPNMLYVISIEAVPVREVPAKPTDGDKTTQYVLNEPTGSMEDPVGIGAEKPAMTETVWELLARLAGTIDGPPDWSAEHDHYIHGTPKRSEEEGS